jgi:hypothetical protein
MNAGSDAMSSHNAVAASVEPRRHPVDIRKSSRFGLAIKRHQA